MRLTAKQLKIIKQITLDNFGDTSKVYLFGSRVDDTKKGGDIDLFIKADFSNEELFIRKIKTLSEIQFKLGERKIDIVTYSGQIDDRAPLIVKEAMMNGVEL